MDRYFSRKPKKGELFGRRKQELITLFREGRDANPMSFVHIYPLKVSE